MMIMNKVDMSESLLFNVNLFSNYNGENKIIFNEMMIRWLGPLCARPTLVVVVYYSASSLKQQSRDRHVAPVGHIIMILNQSVFALSP